MLKIKMHDILAIYSYYNIFNTVNKIINVFFFLQFFQIICFLMNINFLFRAISNYPILVCALGWKNPIGQNSTGICLRQNQATLVCILTEMVIIVLAVLFLILWFLMHLVWSMFISYAFFYCFFHISTSTQSLWCVYSQF